MPADIAYDPDGLKQSLAQLAERIGCTECMSGATCLLTMERDLIFDARKNLGSTVSGQHWTDEAPINVGLSDTIKYDLKKVFTAIDKVIDVIGSHPCLSGFDVLLQDELRTVVIDRDLAATSFVGGF